MTLNDCNEILQKFDLYWHETLGLEGNYYLGNIEAKLALSLITYKRVCDCVSEYQDSEDKSEYSGENSCKHNFIPWDYSCFEYRTTSRWEYVMKQANKIKALSDAIECINVLNYRNIAYGDCVIPKIHYRDSDEVILNKVLEKWMSVLSSVNLDNQALSNYDWLQFSRLLRSTIDMD